MVSASIEEFNNPEESKIIASGGGNKRRKKVRLFGLLIIIVVITGIAGLGFTRGFYDKHPGSGPMGFMMFKIAKELDLSEQQKAEVEKIRDEIKAKRDQNRESRKQDMTEMEQMFRGDTFDKNKALEFAKQQDAKRDEMRSFMIDEMAKFHSILTPDQRNKAADKMKEFRDKKMDRGGMWKDKRNK